METLGLNPWGFFVHVVNFILLLILLRVFLYPPILRMLDERQARIRESMERAEALRVESERAQQEVQRTLAEARSEGQRIIAQATEIADRLQRERQAAAEAEYQRILQRAQEDARREREQAFAELRDQIADLAVMAASRIIHRQLDPATQRQLVNEFLVEATDGRRS
ncbi:MAG: F0F1 ATP synthase subunit B [Chloroflexi bacterium]|nr:F0F1 ATP synthase subunit B [Chloroflexota bacterium]